MPYKCSYYPKPVAHGRMSGSLCAGCLNAVPSIGLHHGCEWSTNYNPVPNWIATPTEILCGYAMPTKSYCVHECPKFIPDCTEEDLQIMGIQVEVSHDIHHV